MATTNSVFRGSMAVVKVSLLGSSEEFNLADETTVFSAEFYIQKKQSKGSVIITKDKMFFDPEEPDSFVAHVPTDVLGDGIMCCTISGEYVDEEHSGVGEPLMLPFVYSTTTPIIIISKYL